MPRRRSGEEPPDLGPEIRSDAVAARHGSDGQTSTAPRFKDALNARAGEISGTRSGARSRLRLMAAGCALLDGTAFRDLLVEDVCRKAGVAKGTFYIYFKSKDVFLRELANDYMGFELESYPAFAREAGRYANTRRWIAWYEDMFAANVGLLRCLVQMGSEDAEMRELWHRRNGLLVDRALAGEAKRLTPEALAVRRWALRAAGGMLDQSLFERFDVQLGPGLDEPTDPDLRIELHALLNYRALTGRDPSDDALPPDSPLRALLRGDRA